MLDDWTNEILNQLAQVHHCHSHGGSRLRYVVDGRDRRIRVTGEPLESERMRGCFAIDGKSRSGERGSAERTEVDGAESMPDAIGVARQKFARAKQVMRECGGLRRLRMGMSRHHRFQIPSRQIE
jgi:hypothetical protein